MEQTIVSFPGIGIEAFTMQKIAFTIPLGGGIAIRWYAILVTLGIVAGFLYALYRGKEEGFTFEDITDYFLVTLLLAVIGARAYYVLTTLGEGRYRSLYDVIAVWEGGIAIYGAILGGALGLFLVSRWKRCDRNRMLRIFDAVAPGVMLGQIIGRFGNFVNGEAHGVATGLDYFLRMGLYDQSGTRVAFYHPTFLYESLWNLVGFVLIHVFYRKKKFDGQVLLTYLAYYGFGRMLIEGLRTDSLYVGAFRISQVLGFLSFVICTTLLVYLLQRERRHALDEEDYVPLYEKSRSAGVRPKSADQREAEKEAGDAIEAIISRAEAARKQEKKGEDERNG